MATSAEAGSGAMSVRERVGSHSHPRRLQRRRVARRVMHGQEHVDVLNIVAGTRGVLTAGWVASRRCQAVVAITDLPARDWSDRGARG